MRHPRTLGTVIALGFAVLTAQGASIYVPDDEPTIQGGLDAAADGDTVIVRSGTYSGPQNRQLDFHGRSVSLRSDAGSAHTTIDCGGTRGFNLTDFAVYDPVIQGFTVCNGYASQGGAMKCTNGARPTLRDIVFTSNAAQSDGGAAYCAGHPAQATFVDCVFAGNHAPHGGGLRNYGSVVKMTRCVFSGNAASHEGGGIHHGINVAQLAELELIDVVFEDNHAVHGGGLSTANDCLCYLASVEFRGNTAAETGGAMRCIKNSNPPVLEEVILVGNTAAAGGAVYSYRTSAVLTNCTLTGNSATSGACLYCSGHPVDPCVYTVSNSILAFSTEGSAVWCDGTTHMNVACCDVFGNAGGDWTDCIADQNGVDGNFCQDPLFCLGANPDDPLALHADSPCAPQSSPFCGLIGARGVSCGATPVQGTSWSRIKAMYR